MSAEATERLSPGRAAPDAPRKRRSPILAGLAWCTYALSSVGLVTGALLSVLVKRDGSIACWMARRLWGPMVLKCYGAELVPEKLEHVPRDGSVVFVANHQSALDIPAIFAALPIDIRFVAKDELKWLPFIGLYMMVGGHVFVKRGVSAAARLSMKRAADKIRQGVPVCVFAEGTRSTDLGLQPFKKGAFVMAIEAGAPIVPLVIDQAGLVVGKRGLVPTPGPLYVRLGEPIPTKGLGYEDRDRLLEETRERMKGLLVEMRSDHPPPVPLPLESAGA